MKGRANKGWIAIGLIMAIAAFGVAFYVSQSALKPPPPAIPSNGQVVVIAKVSIPAGTLITPNMLELTRIKGLLPFDAYTSCVPLVGAACGTPATPTTSYYALVAISANTVVTQSLVSPSKNTATPAFANLNLPPGDVALALPLTAQESVAGYLQAGDYIDIIATDTNGDTSFAFEDIPVLSVGGPAATGASQSSAGGGLVVLEVTRSQALGLTEMQKSGDIYDVVLRSAADYGHGYIPVTNSPTNNYNQSCTVGSKVNPLIASDLNQAQAAESAASRAFSTAQSALTKTTNALASAPRHSSQAAILVQQEQTYQSEMAQDQFSMINAQNEIAADQAVLYCGASSALTQSQNNGLAQGSPKLLQGLFGAVG